jgi:hypothetical protein
LQTLIPIKWIGNPHFIEVCITRKRDQTGLLVLPAEATDSRCSSPFGDGNRDNSPLEISRLAIPNSCEGAIGNGFNKPITKYV